MSKSSIDTGYRGPEQVPIDPPVVSGPFIKRGPAEDDELVRRVTFAPSPADLEEAAAWNEARLERKLNSDRERAVDHWHELMGDNSSTSLRLNAIRFKGLRQTRASFLHSVVSNHLADLPPRFDVDCSSSAPIAGQTLEGVLNTTRELTATLAAFDIFSAIEPSLERSSGVLSDAGDVDLVFDVRERSRYMVKTATDVGNGEGSANGSATIRNAFGGGEKVEANVSFGTRTKSAFQLNLDAPVNGSATTSAGLSVFSAERDLGYFASCAEQTKGLTAKLNTISRFGIHEFSYQACLRTIHNLTPSASKSVRLAAGHSTKSSLSHVFSRDSRDDPAHPTRGVLTKLSQELAGFGGDVNFLKAESEHSTARHISDNVVLSAGVRTGVLFPFGNKQSLFVDRFQLGGPTSVRMFRPNSIGPRDSGDFLGGDLHWSAGLSLIAPFPFKPQWPVQSHAFINAGKLTSWGQPEPLKSLWSEPVVTVGLGLIYRHSLVRVEGNVGVPLAAASHEGAIKGLQFGLGFSFL